MEMRCCAAIVHEHHLKEYFHTTGETSCMVCSTQLVENIYLWYTIYPAA